MSVLDLCNLKVGIGARNLAMAPPRFKKFFWAQSLPAALSSRPLCSSNSFDVGVSTIRGSNIDPK